MIWFSLSLTLFESYNMQAVFSFFVKQDYNLVAALTNFKY